MPPASSSRPSTMHRVSSITCALITVWTGEDAGTKLTGFVARKKSARKNFVTDLRGKRVLRSRPRHAEGVLGMVITVTLAVRRLTAPRKTGCCRLGPLPAKAPLTGGPHANRPRPLRSGRRVGLCKRLTKRIVAGRHLKEIAWEARA